MFCFQCGQSLPDGARFCSSCGTSLANGPSPAPSQASPTPHSPPTQSNVYPTMNSASVSLSQSSVLTSPSEFPQPAFENLAAALFHGLDQSVQPQRTGGLEVSKMTAYRTMGGLTIPPYYGEHVLPTYANVIGIELVAGQPPDRPVISYSGWHQFLLQKFRLEPEQSFYHITRVLSALNIRIVLNRADFPPFPDPIAVSKENQFKQQIYSMARTGLGMGRMMGGGSSFLGGGGGGGGGGQTSLSTAMAYAKIAAQGSANIMNASLPGGASPWYVGN